MPKLTTMSVYELCNDKRWFTHGSNSQYDRMFNMVREGKPIHEIALVIWICSDPKWTVEEIESALNGVVIKDV